MSPPTTLRPEAAHGRKSSPKPLKFIHKTAISGRAPKPRRIQDRNEKIFSENSKMTHFFDQKVCQMMKIMKIPRNLTGSRAWLIKENIFSSVHVWSK